MEKSALAGNMESTGPGTKFDNMKKNVLTAFCKYHVSTHVIYERELEVK
jgi:hypothetical protein